MNNSQTAVDFQVHQVQAGFRLPELFGGRDYSEKKQNLSSETNVSFCCLAVEQVSRDISMSLSALPLSLPCLLLPWTQFPRAIPVFAYNPSPHSIVLRQDQTDPFPVFPGVMEAQESQGVNPGQLPSGLYHKKCGKRLKGGDTPPLLHSRETHTWSTAPRPGIGKTRTCWSGSRGPFPIRKAERVFSQGPVVTEQGAVDKEWWF